jgi:hypothetical protein
MPLAFSGPATRLGAGDIEAAAKSIGCQSAAVRAVIDVESRGGFLPDGRPKILFERHYFARLTKDAYSAKHPGISNRTSGGYLGGPAEYDRLAEAIALDRDAALRSASWGMFQIMGNNFAVAGFKDAESFVAAMVSGEPAQLQAFIGFVKKNGLADELIRLDWAGFARGYNGENYAKNAYDKKMAAAYLIHSNGGARVDAPMPVLKMGATGEAVEQLQRLLKLTPDGDFGPNTKAAVIKFQKANGLGADGVVGAGTWGKLHGG